MKRKKDRYRKARRRLREFRISLMREKMEFPSAIHDDMPDAFIFRSYYDYRPVICHVPKYYINIQLA